MPVQACQVDGRPGLRWGTRGKCYGYDPDDPESKARARAKALRQARAIIARGGEKSMDTETVISFGDAVKRVGDDRVEGYLIRFTTDVDPDLTKDFFTRETDYDVEEWPAKSSVYFDHGLDRTVKHTRLGKASLKMDDVGIWAEGVIDKANAYASKVLELVEAGKLGWSSGTANHLVAREEVGEAKRILRWPLGLDASLTPTPAEPRNLAVVSVKAWWEALSGDPEVASLATDADSDTITVEEIKTVRDFEAFLREAGWPKDAAVTIASHGFKALVRRDSGERVSEADRLRLEQIRFAAQRRQRNHEWTGELRL